MVDRRPYYGTRDARYFARDLKAWKDHFSFDAIFFAGWAPQATGFIAEARKLGLKVPIMGGVGLDSPQLIELGGHSVEGTLVGSYFHPEDPRSEVQELNES